MSSVYIFGLRCKGMSFFLKQVGFFEVRLLKRACEPMKCFYAAKRHKKMLRSALWMLRNKKARLSGLAYMEIWGDAFTSLFSRWDFGENFVEELLGVRHIVFKTGRIPFI